MSWLPAPLHTRSAEGSTDCHCGLGYPGHALPEPTCAHSISSDSNDAAAIRTHALDTWVDTIRDTFVALDITPDRTDRFTGAVRTTNLAHLMAADVYASSQSFERTARLTARHPAELLQIGMVVAGEGLLVQDGRSCVLGQGDFAIYETSRPFTWQLRPEFHMRVYTWPRASIALAPSRSAEITARAVRADAPIGRLVSPALTGLLTGPQRISTGGAVRLADEIAELAITAALEVSEPDEPDRQSHALYSAVLAHIDTHIDDIELTPRSIAEEFFVSTRTLHRLFARFDETVAGTIRSRRLESCRRAMLFTRNANSSLTEIASRNGFGDLAKFSRAFTAAYGISPSRYRATHR